MWSAGASGGAVCGDYLILLTINRTFIKLFWREHYASLREHQLRTLGTTRLLIGLAASCAVGTKQPVPPVRCSRCLEACEDVPIGQSAQHVKVTNTII